MSRVHRSWLLALVAAQLLFLVTMPVFSGNDERGHIARLWSVAEGHLICKTMPQAVRELDAMQSPHRPFREYWKAGLALTGSSDPVSGWSYACYYFPLALFVPAAVSRVIALDLHGEPRRGGMFLSTYASRLVSLIFVDVALWFFLVSVPWARTTVLALFSVPMMIEQSVSFGHDYLCFACTLCILALVFTRSDWRAVAIIAALATVMTLIKPVFAFFSLLALPMIVRLCKDWRGLAWWQRALAFSWLLPFPSYAIWYKAGRVAKRMWAPSFVHPKEQLNLLLHDPLKIVQVMGGYLHYFIDDHKLIDFTPRRINGEWTTLILGNLWLEMPRIGCYAAIVGVLFAVAGDLGGSPVTQTESEPSRFRALARIVATGGVAAAIPATVLALYITYTPVGHVGPYAVQGRYHACALVSLFVIGVFTLRRRWPAHSRPSTVALACTLVALLAMAVTLRYAFVTIWHNYYV